MSKVSINLLKTATLAQKCKVYLRSNPKGPIRSPYILVPFDFRLRTRHQGAKTGTTSEMKTTRTQTTTSRMKTTTRTQMRMTHSMGISQRITWPRASRGTSSTEKVSRRCDVCTTSLLKSMHDICIPDVLAPARGPTFCTDRFSVLARHRVRPMLRGRVVGRRIVGVLNESPSGYTPPCILIPSMAGVYILGNRWQSVYTTGARASGSTYVCNRLSWM